MLKNDWGVTTYPCVAGHEGTGKISVVGSEVKSLSVGDWVGIGWLRDACGACLRCKAGEENLCAEGYQGTYLGSAAGNWGKKPYNQQGCFAKK